MRRFLLVIFVLCLAFIVLKAQDSTELRIRTTYSADGEARNYGSRSAGWHRISGKATLANGEVTITLNDSPKNGKQVTKFTADTTFYGQAHPISSDHVGNRYTVFPLSGLQFKIISTDSTDTATVRWIVEGE